MGNLWEKSQTETVKMRCFFSERFFLLFSVYILKYIYFTIWILNISAAIILVILSLEVGIQGLNTITIYRSLHWRIITYGALCDIHVTEKVKIPLKIKKAVIYWQYFCVSMCVHFTDQWNNASFQFIAFWPAFPSCPPFSPSSLFHLHYIVNLILLWMPPYEVMK